MGEELGIRLGPNDGDRLSLRVPLTPLINNPNGPTRMLNWIVS
jgi:hypothetical protein